MYLFFLFCLESSLTFLHAELIWCKKQDPSHKIYELDPVLLAKRLLLQLLL